VRKVLSVEWLNHETVDVNVPRVLFKQSSYDYALLREDIFGLLKKLDGGRMPKGSPVLIKPNLLCTAQPEQAVTTHPLVIRAVVEYVLERGGRPTVADSPATGSFRKIVRECGVEDALESLPVKVVPLEEPRTVGVDGRWKSIELAAEALDADVIINLPKLKTHSQMTLTLGVKNLFGCVVGMQKPEWHFRVGEDKHLFAELLVTIWSVLQPSLTLVDGILGMEGAGPGTGGTPKEMGILVAGDDARCVDHAICLMLGISPRDVPTNRAAEGMGFTADYDVEGAIPEVGGFSLPETRDLLFGPPALRGFLRRHMASRPESSGDLCRYCNECVNICPAGAVTNPGKGLAFDYDRCIRCYCCLEVCPHGAMQRKDTIVKRAITTAIRAIRR
jgi:uncharacterized protein (DUF362 family)/Pyruvate/2-oxoacid:ferredoxin oxidoreductase delta subunit